MHPPDPHEQSRLTQHLMVLKTEHRDLDVEISRLQLDPGVDELVVKRLKRQKLQLKDCIERLESALIPDQPA